MSNTGTRNERTETISDLSLKLKQQKQAKNSKIRVRLTQKFKKPAYFTAHHGFSCYFRFTRFLSRPSQ